LPVFSTGNEKKGITVFSGRDPDKKPGNGARFGVILLWVILTFLIRGAQTGDRREEDYTRGGLRDYPGNPGCAGRFREEDAKKRGLSPGSPGKFNIFLCPQIHDPP